MAARRSPSRASIALTLVAAAVIGFLLGALVAATEDSPLATPGVTGQPTPSPTPTGTGTTSSPGAAVDAELTLSADRESAERRERITLTGVLRPATGGVELQVQQSVDDIGFVDFPVTATTRSDGSYQVQVATGRAGTNEFRMVTQVDGQQVVSDPVTVEVG